MNCFLQRIQNLKYNFFFFLRGGGGVGGLVGWSE